MGSTGAVAARTIDSKDDYTHALCALEIPRLAMWPSGWQLSATDCGSFGVTVKHCRLIVLGCVAAVRRPMLLLLRMPPPLQLVPTVAAPGLFRSRALFCVTALLIEWLGLRCTCSSVVAAAAAAVASAAAAATVATPGLFWSRALLFAAGATAAAPATGTATNTVA